MSIDQKLKNSHPVLDVTIGDGLVVQVKALSVRESMEFDKATEELDEEAVTAHMLYLSTYHDGERAFSSPEVIPDLLTLEDLTKLCEAAGKLNGVDTEEAAKK